MFEAVLPFTLYGNHFALPLRQVQRVLPMLPVDTTGDLPGFVLGLVNLHGEPVPVIDLAQRLGWPSSKPSLWQPYIWCRLSNFSALLAVDTVGLVCHVDGANSASAEAMNWPDTLLETLVPHEDGLLFIQNLERLLSTQQAEQVAAVVLSWRERQEAAS